MYKKPWRAITRKSIAVFLYGVLAIIEPKQKTDQPINSQPPPISIDKSISPMIITKQAGQLCRLTGINLNDLNIISLAAERNSCQDDNFLILIAIRKSENGRPGLEFGIKHSKCDKQMKQRPGETMDIQAGWAAATIVNNRKRWNKPDVPKIDVDGADGFIVFLGDRYCPEQTDPDGNLNWKSNVSGWYRKLKKACKGCND